MARVRGATLNLSRRLLTLFIYLIYNSSASTCLRHGPNIPAQKKGQLERAEYLLEHTQKKYDFNLSYFLAAKSCLLRFVGEHLKHGRDVVVRNQ